MEKLQSFAASALQEGWKAIFYKFSDQLMDGLFIFDEAGYIRYVNGAYCDITGFRREELMEKPLERIQGFSKLPLAELIKKIKTEGNIKREMTHFRKDGTSLQVEVSISRLKIENEHQYLALMCELTEYKESFNILRAESSLKELALKSLNRKDYFRTAIELLKSWTGFSCVGIRVLDEEGNLPYEAYVGFSREFWKTENWLSAREHQCVCTRVINEAVQPWESSCKTQEGSIRSDNFTTFAEDNSDRSEKRYRGTCAKCGYNSLAVIPIRHYNSVLGLIHLADDMPGKASLRLVKGIESIAPILGEAVYRYNMEETLRRNYDTQSIINSLLRMSLSDAPLNDILQHALERLCSLSWRPFKPWGAIYLKKEKSKEYVLVVQKGIKESGRSICNQVLPGKCICGKAAQTGEIQFVACIDEAHEVIYEGMQPHGHYCVPIVSNSKVLGVINLYLNEGTRRQRKDEDFLNGIADKLAEIIIRVQAERQLLESKERYRSLVQQSSDGVCVFDPETKKIQESNNRLLKMLGYTEKEIIKMTVNDFHAMEDKVIETTMKKLFNKGQVNFGERVFKRKDGTLLEVEVSASLVDIGTTQVVMANVRDISERKKAAEKLRQSFKHLRNTLRETVNALTLTAEKRDPYTVGHQHRVSRLACAIAEHMDCSEEIIQGIKIAGVLHDIGKVGIPIEILTKPGRLTELEMAIIKTHPQVGFEIIQRIPFEYPVAQIVLQHHERYNGSGYPLGLTGESILQEARILAVADVVEAMASHRPYRPTLGIEVALEEIEKNSGLFYDPEVVKTCLELFKEKKYSLE